MWSNRSDYFSSGPTMLEPKRLGDEFGTYQADRMSGMSSRGLKSPARESRAIQYEQGGTMYFSNPNSKEREYVTPSGQRVVILGKAVNTESNLH